MFLYTWNDVAPKWGIIEVLQTPWFSTFSLILGWLGRIIHQAPSFFSYNVEKLGGACDLLCNLEDGNNLCIYMQQKVWSLFRYNTNNNFMEFCSLSLIVVFSSAGVSHKTGSESSMCVWCCKRIAVFWRTMFYFVVMIIITMSCFSGCDIQIII